MISSYRSSYSIELNVVLLIRTSKTFLFYEVGVGGVERGGVNTPLELLGEGGTPLSWNFPGGCDNCF